MDVFVFIIIMMIVISNLNGTMGISTQCVMTRTYVANVPTQTQLGKPAVVLSVVDTRVCVSVCLHTAFVYNFPCIDFWIFFFSSWHCGLLSFSCITFHRVSRDACVCVVYVLLYENVDTSYARKLYFCVFFNQKLINIFMDFGDSCHRCTVQQVHIVCCEKNHETVSLNYTVKLKFIVLYGLNELFIII